MRAFQIEVSEVPRVWCHLCDRRTRRIVCAARGDELAVWLCLPCARRIGKAAEVKR